MWSTQRKMALGGVVAAVVIGGGGGFAVAHAQEASSTPTASPTSTSSPTSSSSSATKAGKTAKAADRTTLIGDLKDFQHAEWVSKGAHGYVTHDAVLGQVTAVSATSVTVQAADGTNMTFAVDSSTKVKPLAAVAARTGKKATATATPSATASSSTTSSSPATIADVTTGQTVLVSGEKSPDLTAQNVLVRKS